MILTAVFGMWSHWPGTTPSPYKPIGTIFLIFILLAILGWQVFGAAIHR
jgi:hypothetical protein